MMTTDAAPPPSPERQPRERKKPRTRRFGPLVRYSLFFITIVLIADAVFGEKGFLALVEARREFVAIERALGRARDENAALREDARRLREDPSAVEALARRELGLIKPGEKLFIVKDAKPK